MNEFEWKKECEIIPWNKLPYRSPYAHFRREEKEEQAAEYVERSQEGVGTCRYHRGEKQKKRKEPPQIAGDRLLRIACDTEIPCDDGGNKEGKSDARDMIPKDVIEKEGETDRCGYNKPRTPYLAASGSF